jgi:hypothetical protein
MPKTIRAVFENGLFRPTEPVDLPDACEVQIEILAQGPAGNAIPPRPAPTVTWDELFANKLVIGSAPPDENDDDVELTGDDFLY